jgi:hypothetical protein
VIGIGAHKRQLHLRAAKKQAAELLCIFSFLVTTIAPTR